jgi:hypothetical protein
MEIWKSIPNYEGLYEVSSLGNIKGLMKNVFDKNGNLHYVKKEKVFSKRKSKDGYYVTDLTNCSIKKTFKVHQLVAMAFLNHKPNGMKLVIDHRNNDPLDNRVENLQIVSVRKNSSKDKKDKSSQYTGVSWDKSNNKWKSQIYINGKSKHLGSFNCELSASLAYQNKLKEKC